MAGSILFIQSDSNAHLGLFEDLRKSPDVEILTYPGHTNVFRKVLTRVSPKLSFESLAGGVKECYDKVVVVDTALARMDAAVLARIQGLSDDVRVVVLNSLDAASPSFQGAKKLLGMFDPSAVYTFDPVDAERCGYRFLGRSYYSEHKVESAPVENDAYFIGGLKGSREAGIVELCRVLGEGGFACRFDCVTVKGGSVPDNLPDGMRVVSSSWIPYAEILDGVARTRCVVEILQHGQHGQSIRYFEAVCQNRNLLTNNPRIFELPYYDPEHMFYFENPRDVDCKALLDASLPDYGYAGEFSPLNLEVLK